MELVPPNLGTRFSRFRGQLAEFLLCRLFQEDLAPLCGYNLDKCRIAQVEEGPLIHGSVVEDAVQNLQLRHALARMVSDPSESLTGVGREFERHPSIAL